MDFSNMTQMDIRELIREANKALEDYTNREKIKCYSNFVPFDGWRRFISEECAKQDLIECIEEGIYSDDEFKIKASYLTLAELEYCKDFWKNGEAKINSLKDENM